MMVRPNDSVAGRTETLVLTAAAVLPMTTGHPILSDAAVAVAGGVIVEVGSIDEVRAHHPDATVLARPSGILTPGLVDAHQHLTGDRLARCAIPDSVSSGTAIFSWAVPLHAAHRRDDDELSALLACAEALSNGITTVVEAGTVAHPDAVAAAMERAGIRGLVGRWAWDRAGGGPFEADAASLLDSFDQLLDAYPPRSRVQAAVTLVGHDLVSDELVQRGAALARKRGALMTMHLSPTDDDTARYLERTGRRPVEHLSDLGVLGPHLLLGHAVHLDPIEIELAAGSDTAIVTCPWAYLRMAQGVTVAGRHHAFLSAGGRLALGCDSENAGDQLDILRAAALAVGLMRDRAMDPGAPGAWTALDLATRGGAEAIGLGEDIGTIEVGKRADLVLHQPRWSTGGGDPAQELIWGGDGRQVRDVVVDGQLVVRDRQLLTLDLDDLSARAMHAGAALRRRAGVGS
jgi:5-methylthioadenosine/S-adenosylhomocysteine deaminase